MGEISGFGGGYEAECQKLLNAGVEWLESHSDQRDKLRIKTYEGVYGLATAETPETKELEEAILAAGADATGAMHHAVMGRLMWIARHGWEEYVTMTKRREILNRKSEAMDALKERHERIGKQMAALAIEMAELEAEEDKYGGADNGKDD